LKKPAECRAGEKLTPSPQISSLYSMKRFFIPKLLLVSFWLLLLCSPLYASEAAETRSYLSAGIGIEQLTYRELIPDLELISSDTELANWVLHVEARKALEKIFVGARGYIPLSSDEAREYWTRAGEFEQTNTLTYRWARADVQMGYFLHRLLNPYIGIQWAYSEQERGDFENVSTPGIIGETATEEVYSFAALIGIQGEVPFAAGWSLSYFAEYMLPFYSNTKNDGLPGWEASNIDGFSYALTAQLKYAFTDTVSVALQGSFGKQHWEGSDWIPYGASRIKWPENDTDFVSGFVSILKYF
jgi:hypothetical protein